MQNKPIRASASFLQEPFISFTSYKYLNTDLSIPINEAEQENAEHWETFRNDEFPAENSLCRHFQHRENLKNSTDNLFRR